MEGGQEVGLRTREAELNTEMGLRSRKLWNTETASAVNRIDCSRPKALQESMVESPTSLSAVSAEKVIGQGSFGCVYLATAKQCSAQTADRKPNHVIALKVIPKKANSTAEAQRWLYNELCALQTCNHPFIVKFCFAEETLNHICIATEFCPGGEMFRLMFEKQVFTADDVRFYAAEIALALGHLHSHDIIYRDLKPENITIDADGHIRLIDFGLAIKMTEEEHFSPEAGRKLVVSSSGTLNYCAPEVLRRVPHGPETDWWSLGVLLYELYFGSLPFQSTETEDLCNEICSQPILRPEPLLEEEFDLFRLVQGLMNKDQNRRLGAEANGGLGGLQKQPFFNGLDWDLILKKEVPAPWVPSLDSVCDTSYFDEEFTSQPVAQFS
mmetsp:Transcript_7457/g.10450  ORF Transcript_7457/g.10450 Transcript_7457/m.10450 type:complete len:383 (+) Transcript_7457:134-1282(+)